MSVSKLIKVANILYFKHLQKFAINADEVKNYIVKSLTDDLQHASTVSSFGIIPFEKMAKEDGITLTFDITRNDGWGTRNIIVNNIAIFPPDKNYLLPKYQVLKDQLQDYLEKYWEIFPGVTSSGEKIDYKNFNVKLTYGE